MEIAKKYMLAAKEQDPSLPIDANGARLTGEAATALLDLQRRVPPLARDGRRE